MDQVPAGFEPDESAVPPGFEPTNSPSDVPAGFVPQEDIYSTPGQQLGTMVEGAAQGVAGPLATAAELGLSKLGVPNMTAEDIKGREETNPMEHGVAEAGGFGASLLAGYGEAKVISKIAEKFTPEAMSFLGKLGSKAINGAIQGGLFSGANEINKGLLDQGDPSHPVANVIAGSGAAGLLNIVLGAGGQLGSKAAQLVEKSDFAPKVNEFLTGMGLASTSTPEEISSYLSGDNSIWGKRGLKAYGALHAHLTGAVVGNLAAQALPMGNDTWYKRYGKDILGTAVGAFLGPKVSEKVASSLAPSVYKVLGSGVPQGAEQSINYALRAMQGANKVSKGIDSLFDYGTSKAVDEIDPGKHLDNIKEWIDNGGAEQEPQTATPAPESPQSFAEGGEVNQPPQPGGLATHFPVQNILLNAAKGRVSQFLSSAKPMSNPAKLPYDTDHKSHQKEHEYEQFIKLANQPLTILNKIKDGSLSVAHAAAFKSMYPELHQELSHRMNKRIIKDHIDSEKKPPYHMRQAMSLFLGQNLESTLTPGNIQAAQNTFVVQKAQQAQGNAPPNSKSELSKIGQNAQTPDQARQQRLIKA